MVGSVAGWTYGFPGGPGGRGGTELRSTSYLTKGPVSVASMTSL